MAASGGTGLGVLQVDGEQDGLCWGGSQLYSRLPLHVGAVAGDGAAGGPLDIDGGDELVLIDQLVLDHLGGTRTRCQCPQNTLSCFLWG